MQNKAIKQWKLEPAGAARDYVARVHGEQPESTCPVTKLYGFLDAVRRDTCGECVICREGLLQTAILAQGLTEGTGRADDLALLTELGRNLTEGSCCEYGKVAGAFLERDLAADMEQFEKHLKRKRCDAEVCAKLESAPVANPSGAGLMGGTRRRRSSAD